MTKIDTSLISIEAIAGHYMLAIQDLDCAVSTFKENNIVPTGHVWESLIKNYCLATNFDVSKFSFDSESDLFAVYSTVYSDLEQLGRIITSLIGDTEKLAEFLKNVEIEDEFEFSVEEFLDTLEYNSVNISKPIELMFTIEFSQQDAVLTACRMVSQKGYPCIYQNVSPPYFFSASATMVPSRSAIEAQISYFKEVSNYLDGISVDCEEAKVANPMDVYATDWKQYED